MRQVTITKLFQKNALKSFEFEEVLTTFPSYGVMLKSYNDLNPFMSTELKGGTKGCSIVSIPLSKANSVINYLHKNYSEEIVGSFYKRHPLMIDWETEYWYSSNQQTEGRKKGFEAIKGKPHGWEKLYSIPDKKNPKKGNHVLMRKEYAEKIKLFFSDEKKMVSLINSTMKYAYNDLKTTIITPPTPLIINTGISLQTSIRMNEIFNKYRQTLGLLSACSYNLHHSAFNQESTYDYIINQLHDVLPKIVVISTPTSENYLEEYIHTNKLPIFKKFIKELTLFSITSGAIIIWYNKGHYTSNHGLRVLKDGIDCFMYPLKGTCKEGGGGSLPFGERYSMFLDDYKYIKWDRYLTLIKNKGVGCHLPCCEKENYNSLKDLTDRQQWDFKRKHELFTRSGQIKQLIEKLNKDGNLDDFSFRLERNNL